MIEATRKQKFLYLFPHKNQGLSTPRAFYFLLQYVATSCWFQPIINTGSTSKYTIRSRVQHRVYKYQLIVQYLKNSPKLRMSFNGHAKLFPNEWKTQIKKKYGVYLISTSVIYIIINILAMKANGSHGLARKLGNWSS